MTVSSLGEHALIDRIHARVPPAPAGVVVGIGDDAAVVEPDRGTLDVLTVDTLVEGVHFDFAFTSGRDLGFKALAVNLSDLAAMGAAPRLALLSLALRPDLPITVVDAIVDGLLELALAERTSLVGGNIATSPHAVVVSVTAVGSVKRRKILTREGARPGDELWVSGVVGGARAGLEWLQAHGGAGEEATLRAGRERYLRPQPRTRLGMQLGRNRAARAAIDLSDGLADGVRQIARAGRVGAIVEAADVPIDPEARGWFQRRGVDPMTAALTGGDDYELLFVAPRTSRRRLTAVRRLVGGIPLTKIGEITKDPVVRLRRDGRDEDLPEGFEHFRGGSSQVGVAG